MSEAKQDGGPVYPAAMYETEHGDKVYPVNSYEGVSLHQWYAGMALQGLLAHYGAGQTRNDLVDLSLQYADAMIREGQK